MKSDWNELAKTYPIDSRNSLNRALDIVREEVGRFDTAADVGCGPGNFTVMIAELFGRVYASDLSPDMLGRVQDECRARGITNVDTVRSDAL